MAGYHEKLETPNERCTFRTLPRAYRFRQLFPNHLL